MADVVVFVGTVDDNFLVIDGLIIPDKTTPDSASNPKSTMNLIVGVYRIIGRKYEYPTASLFLYSCVYIYSHRSVKILR